MPCQNCSCPSCLALVGLLVPPTELPLPPSELMQTNRAATDPEMAHSRSVIDSAKKKISLIRAAMANLTEQTANIRRVIKTHRAAISPLKAFPPELLVAIFAEYTNMMKIPWIRLTYPASPLILTWICSQWRRIVLDTPQFWTRISDSTPMVDLWINRSKGLPLNLHFDLSSGDTNPAMGALIPQAHRWERVHFTLRSNSNSILSPAKGHLRSLKKLGLSYLDTTGTLDFCEGAPQLTKIQLDKVLNPLAIKLPWEQLQDCTLGGSLIMLYTLQQAKNIQTCHLRMVGHLLWDRAPMPVPGHVCHSRLSTLIISHWHSRDYRMDSFFSSLTLLSLQTLELQFPVFVNYPQRLAHTLFEFFKRSSRYLAVLKLSDIPFPPSSLINWFTLMLSLVSLDIKFVRDEVCLINDDFLDHLGFGHTNHLLPCLNSLNLRGPASFSEESLRVLIASRRDIKPQDVGVAVLETLVLDCTVPRDWSRRHGPPSFQRFISKGLNITYGADWNISDSDSSTSNNSE